jgi:uncharacterized protein
VATEPLYIDTSALVKLYVEEPDSAACDATVAGKVLVSSRLTYCEFRSAILGKVFRKAISREFMAEVWLEFKRDIALERIQLVPLDEILVRQAAGLLGGLITGVPLRTLDALHLATYLSIETCPLFTKDLYMLRAARQLGLPLAG